MDVMVIAGVIGLLVIIFGVATLIKMYRKVDQGQALIRNGWGGTKVSFSGQIVVPVLHKFEIMELSVKRIEIERAGADGLICKDNLRADIKVAFFVRVNKTEKDVQSVAESLGVARASDKQAMVELFDAKFSEALKTVGKKFEFVELYAERASFKEQIIDQIGKDLNGYHLEDCAIDYLEQTDIANLQANNILDAEGIKKITELTARQIVLANQIDREREKTIKQQNVEAEEAILEMDRQLAESQERQKREISAIQARETAEATKVQQEERRKAESARIQTEEELMVQEQNKQRQIIVAEKNKQRTEAIETERIEKDRHLEQVERERVTELASIEKERALEVERKNIQDVIRERVAVEKTVVEEEENIKDTKVLAEAERTRKAAVIEAQKEAEQLRVKEVTQAQARKESAELEAQQKIIEAEASQKASDKNAEARKRLAEALSKEEAAKGLAEVQVQEARAAAMELEGRARAKVTEEQAFAEAKGMEAKADAFAKQGAVQADVAEKKAAADARGKQALAEALKVEMLARAEGLAKEGDTEAEVLKKKALAEAEGMAKKGEAEVGVLQKRGEVEAEVFQKRALAEAMGIREKAEAMKLFDAEGRAHEEFKLRLERDLKLSLADIENHRHIAASQAEVLRDGLKSANIDIVGGDSVFFDKLMGAVTQGRSIDRMVGGSKVLTDVKDTFFNGDPAHFKKQLKEFVSQFNMSSEDVKNLTVSALLAKMMKSTDDPKAQSVLGSVVSLAEKFGLGHVNLDNLKD